MAVEANVAAVVEQICAQPTLVPEQVLRLRRAVRNSQAEREALRAQAASLDSGSLPADEKALRACVFAWLLGKREQAEAGIKGLPAGLAALVQGELALEGERAEQALGLLRTAREKSPHAPLVATEVAAALTASGKPDEALAILAPLEKQASPDAEVHYQAGHALEKKGLWEAACGRYEQALQKDPQHADAAFRLAYYLDLRGDNDRAIELYQNVTGAGPAYVAAMVNLALLLEDKDDMDGAIACLKKALRSDPTNRRAALHLRDAIESLDMYYDETERKENERLEAVLRIPICDFELSVRSRNCLAKMNVKTLGDLVRRTEHELLAFKNFGETSLNEIRTLLQSKGLRLGMFKEEEAKRARAQRLRSGGPENAVLSKSVTDLEFSVRARRCMQRLNIETAGDLAEKTEAELLATKNFGQTSLNEVKSKLAELGLGLKPAD